MHADETGGTGDENFQATHLDGTTTNARPVQGAIRLQSRPNSSGPLTKPS
jgi:hypothetical protein